MQSIEKLAWGNRAFDDAVKGKPALTTFPSEAARRVYVDRYRVGVRERAKRRERSHA